MQSEFARNTRPAITADTLLMAALVCSVPLATWLIFGSLGSGSPQILEFELLETCFVLLAIAYLAASSRNRMEWLTAPSLLTLWSVPTFVAFPIWRFAKGEDRIDDGYIRSMVLVLMGFSAFWLACLITRKGSGLRFAPRLGVAPIRVVFVSAAMLTIGIGTNFYLWRKGLFGYLADPTLRERSLGVLQWFAIGGNFLTLALAVSAIEVLGGRPQRPFMKIVFWLSLCFALGFGAISGMKSASVIPLAVVVLILWITKGHLPKVALFLPVLALALIYPFVDAYRANLNSGYRFQSNSIDGLKAVITQSFKDAFLSFESSGSSQVRVSGEVTGRLSYLSYVHDVVGLPAPALLNGDESIWLAPIYPFVPRFLWKDKPVFDKGVRLSLALGRTRATSSAITPIGDLYSMYGTYGVVCGMFAMGILLQLVMNWFGKAAISEAGVLIYVVQLPQLINFEPDFVRFVTDNVQLALIATIISYSIYGRTIFSIHADGSLSQQ